AGEQNATLPTVVQREGEHAVHALEHVDAVAVVQREDDLRVRVRAQPVATLKKVASQLEVVVELAVERDPELAVARAHRLVAALDVDDREASVTEADVSVDDGAAVV